MMVAYSCQQFSRAVQLSSDEYLMFSLRYDCRDDLRTANIIADDENGVNCLVIDRETFNQLISNLDEIRTRYDDEGSERKK